MNSASPSYQLFTPLDRDGQLQDEDFVERKRYKDFSTIDWVEEASYGHKSKRREIRRSLASHEPYWRIRLRNLASNAQSWLVLTAIGVTIGIIAAVLNIVTEWLSDIKNGRCTAGFYLNQDFCCSDTHHETCPEWKEWVSFGPLNYLLYVLFSAVFAFASAILVYFFAPYAAGSGISEIKCIVAGFVMKGFLGARTLAIKGIALPLTIASGLSVGKEGPSVHYAVCVGNTVASKIGKYRKHNAKMREILCACAAAGVAVAFGSPMGGVLFSLEEISASFQLQTLLKSYFCAFVSVGALAAMNPFRTGKVVMFSVTYDRDWRFFEVVPFIIIGIFGGLYGIFTSKWNLRVQAFRKVYLGKYAVEEATILAVVTAIVCYFNQFLSIDMTESMQVLFSECEGMGDDLCNPSHRGRILMSLILGVVIRTVFVIVSYGCKVPAGIFVPSMAIGTLFGRFVGIIVQIIEEAYPQAGIFATCPASGPCITPGTYAFLGAAAALSGIMNLTVTVVVIMFELTGALKYILPTMIVVSTTKIINDRWSKGGIADQAITANGFPYLENNDHYYGVEVAEAMTDFPVAIASDVSLGELNALAKNSDQSGFPVVQADFHAAEASTSTAPSPPASSSSPKVLLGYISRTDVYMILERHKHEGADFDILATRLLNKTPITVRPHVSLESVVEIFQKLGPRVILIDNQYGQLLGLITRKDVLRYQHRVSLQNDEAGGEPASPTMSAAQQMDQWVWDSMVSIATSIKTFIQRAVPSSRV